MGSQRGSGKTLGHTGRAGTGRLTLNRLVQDGIEVAEYLRTRLGKRKIILLASSFGATFALTMVRRRPDLFSAYVGTDQNVGMVRGRESNHRETLGRLRAAGFNRGVAALQRIGADPSRWNPHDFTTTAKWTMKSHSRTCNQTILLVKRALWFSPRHSLRDLKVFFDGMKFSLAQLLPEIRTYDAWREGIQFEIPIFVFQGEHDVVTPVTQAQEYFDDVIAPSKGMTRIRGAGHFAAFLQPSQFLQELLIRVRPIAVQDQ